MSLPPGSAVEQMTPASLWPGPAVHPPEPANQLFTPASLPPGPAGLPPEPADRSPGPASRPPGPAGLSPGPADEQIAPAGLLPEPADVSFLPWVGQWRRGWDSNPRSRAGAAGLRVATGHFSRLSHLSMVAPVGVEPTRDGF